VGVVVRVAEDARRPVRAAAVVTGFELLEEHDVVAASREPPRRGRAHRTGPDDDDVGPHQTGGSGSYWM
jgi:hypothetical protein